MAGTNTSDLDPLFLKALTLLHSKNPNSTEELKALVQGYREKVFGSSVPQASKVCLCYFRIIIYDWQFGSQYPETIGNIHFSQSLFVNIFFVSSGTWPRNLLMLAGYLWEVAGGYSILLIVIWQCNKCIVYPHTKTSRMTHACLVGGTGINSDNLGVNFKHICWLIWSFLYNFLYCPGDFE